MMHLHPSWIRPLVVVGMLLPLSACALSGGPIDGKVIEEGTTTPIPNAIVVARWIGNLWAVVESQTVCVHVLTTTTDTQGRYRLPGWAKASTIGPVTGVESHITAHHPGYQLVRIKPDTTLHLAPFTGTREERLKYLERLEQSIRVCQSPEAGEKNLLPFYRALYEEAKNLAETREDRKIADGFLAGIEFIELGYKEGMRRALERGELRDRQP